MNKVINSRYIKLAPILFLLAATPQVYSQNAMLNKYGLLVIGSIPAYKETVKKNPDKQLVDLTKAVPGLLFDLKYTGTDNFMKTKLYPELATSYLRKPVAAALAAVQTELNRRGLRLKIFDAYRPYSVTEKMWEPVKDDRYAADPKVGSGHNRGIAVDLTVVDFYTKEPLNMGTEFDNFTDSAHHDFNALPKEVLQNRALLRNVMEKNGFKALETEWWHYFIAEGNDYELMDISFEDLGKLFPQAAAKLSAKDTVRQNQ